MTVLGIGAAWPENRESIPKLWKKDGVTSQESRRRTVAEGEDLNQKSKSPDADSVDKPVTIRRNLVFGISLQAAAEKGQQSTAV